MSRHVTARLLALAVAATVAAGFVSAQVVIRQTGQALDSNLQVGSGGYNNVYGGIGGVNSQLYVTGQVSGLGNFRGPVGYYAPNQLNLNLPGAAVTTFRQQSLGVQDVLGGNTYAPAPYYNRSATIWSLGGNAPSPTGIASPLPPVAQPLLPTMPGTESMMYRPFTSSLGGTAALPAFQGPVSATPQTEVKPRQGDSSEGTSDQLPPVGLSPLLRQQLLRNLAEQSGRNPQEADQQVKSEVNADVLSAPPTPPPWQERGASDANSPRQSDNSPTVQTWQPREAQRRPNALLTPPADQDVYVDILVRMQKQGPVQLRLPVPQGVQVSPKGRTSLAADRTPSPQDKGLQTVPLEPAAQPGRQAGPESYGNIVEYSPDAGIILHSLAGRNNDQFNLHMAAAERQLKESRYAEAATNYESAVELDPQNPLARLGQGICSFVKGEYLTSAVHVRRAIEIFAPIAYMRLDLPAMVDNTILQLRITALDNRLSGKRASPPDPAAVFIAAYVHYNLGHLDQARSYARRLLSMPNAEKAFIDFANFLLSSPPASQPASSAAGQGTAPPAER